MNVKSITPPEICDRHVAYIVADQMVELDRSKLEQAIFEACFDRPVKILPASVGHTALIVDFGGLMLSIMNVTKSLPSGWEPAVARAQTIWPKADAVFNSHKAHLIVAPIAEGIEPLETARCMTALIKAVLRSHIHFTAVLWNSIAVTSRDSFLKLSASAFAVYPDYPYRLWINVQLFRDQAGGALVGATFGLKQFAGREIEMGARLEDATMLYERISGLAVYLMRNESCLKSGDTIGVTRWEKIRVDLTMSKHFPATAIFSATLEAA